MEVSKLYKNLTFNNLQNWRLTGNLSFVEVGYGVIFDPESKENIMATRLDFDQKGFDDEIRKVDQAKVKFQNLFTEAIQVLKLTSLSDLKYLAERGQDGFYDIVQRQMNDPGFIGGMKMSKNSAMGFLELPDMQHFQKTASRAKEYIPFLDYLDFDPQEGVRIKDGAEDTIKTRFSVFAANEAEEDLYNALHDACEALTRAQREAESLGTPLIRVVKGQKPLHALPHALQVDNYGDFYLNPSIFHQLKKSTHYNLKRWLWG
jgi:hypothetical protein